MKCLNKFKIIIVLSFFVFVCLKSKSQKYNYKLVWGNNGRVGIHDAISKKFILKSEYAAIEYRGNRFIKDWRKGNYKEGFNDFFWVSDSLNYWALFTFKGKRLTEFEFENGYNLIDNFMPVMKNKKWGGIDMTGKETVPFIYSWLKNINMTCIPAEKDSLWGVIDKSGKTILPFIYTDIYDGRTWLLTQKDRMYYFNPAKRELSKSYDYIYLALGTSSPDHYVLFSGIKCGFLSSYGDSIINPQFDLCEGFENGYARIKLENKWGYINKEGTIKIKCSYEKAENFYDGLAGVYQNGKWGFIDTLGKLIFPFQFSKIYWFKKGLAIVSKNVNSDSDFNSEKGMIIVEANENYTNPTNFKEMQCIINKKGNIISKNYDMIEDSENEKVRFRVKLGNKYGYLDNKGQPLINCIYDDASDFYKGKALVKKNGESFYINSKNEKLDFNE